MSDNDSSTRRKFLRAAGGAGLLGLAGCTGGGGGGGGDTPTPRVEERTVVKEKTVIQERTPEPTEYDFGGAELDVILNVGSIAEAHKRFVIPQMEEKYNLSINSTEAVTTQQLTQVQANPNNPPDVLIPDVIGVERAARNGWLEPIRKHTDIVTNLNKIPSKFVHYDSTGVSWQVGEVLPVINTNIWDSTPTSWDAVMKNGNDMALVPFSWSGGPYLLLMAAAVATGREFSSPSLDVEAGFNYLEEHLKPNVKTTYQGVASAKQQLATGNFDTTLPFWDYMVFDMFQQNAPIETINRPDPVGIAFAETVAVPRGTDKMEASMLYVNECLSVRFQEAMSGLMGNGVTNEDAQTNPTAKDFGAPGPDEFDELAFPDFRLIWENRDAWAERWDEIFAG